jgi:hypothetical protein
MGFWDMLKPGNSAKKPGFNSKEEMVVFLTGAINDSAVAAVIADIFEHTGSHGYIEVKPGGKGDPYEVVYEELKYNNIPPKELAAKIKELEDKLVHAQCFLEMEFLEKQIAELSGAVAVVWANLPPEEFDGKCELFKKAYKAVKEQLR